MDLTRLKGLLDQRRRAREVDEQESRNLRLSLPHLWDEERQLQDAMRLLLQDLEAGGIQPIVAKTFPRDAVLFSSQFSLLGFPES